MRSFFYHHKPFSKTIVNIYDWIVLDQDYPYIDTLIKENSSQHRKAKIFGYISVGEIEKYRSYFEELKKFAVGENTMWDALVADLRIKEYRDFLIEKVAKNIVERGFDVFFLIPLIPTCWLLK